jgi:hypothetical protein
MKARIKIVSFLLLLPLLLASDSAFDSARTSMAAASGERRVRFQIVAIEEKGTERRTLSETTVEGPAGTDFNVELEDGRFSLVARFLTDFLSPEALKVRARLNTRRLYGRSERELPLYEEDTQNETLQLGFDEKIILLPFGRGGDNRLLIEITPTLSEKSARLASGETRPLEIEIGPQSPGGAISVEASKTPHRFVVEAALLEDGREVARGASPYLIEEASELVLQPVGDASPAVLRHPLMVNLTLGEYRMSRTADQISLGFDLYQRDAQDENARAPVARKWAGIAELGQNLTYDLSRSYPNAQGKKYELRFKVKLAPEEQAAR